MKMKLKKRNGKKKYWCILIPFADLEEIEDARQKIPYMAKICEMDEKEYLKMIEPSSK